MRPVLFVTNHAPPDRVGAFEALHRREDVRFALVGGRMAHGAPERGELRVPHRRVSQREVYALAASGRHRAVVCGTSGRLALPAAFAGARRAGVPFVLWASLWSHPKTVAHAFSYPALRWIYAHAQAVVTYGEHVSDYVRARGARNVHVAPQAVDNGFWAAPGRAADGGHGGRFRVLFVGRPVREKGLRVLMEAWRASGLHAPVAALVLVGVEPEPPWVPAGGAVTPVGPRSAAEVRNFYASSDVLVVPSIPTRTFREPWGLVINEAMNQGLAVIATDAVGAVAGGLVRDGHNGLVVPAGDAEALAGALRRLHDDPALRARLGAAGRHDVQRFTQEGWALGFSDALASVGAAREGSDGPEAGSGADAA